MKVAAPFIKRGLPDTSAPARSGWVGPAPRDQKQSLREAQSLPLPEAVAGMRRGRSEGAKNPRDPLRVREAHKTINPEG